MTDNNRLAENERHVPTAVLKYGCYDWLRAVNEKCILQQGRLEYKSNAVKIIYIGVLLTAIYLVSGKVGRFFAVYKPLKAKIIARNNNVFRIK